MVCKTKMVCTSQSFAIRIQEEFKVDEDSGMCQLEAKKQNRSWQQMALLRRFPDVVEFDGTHTTNRFGYKLYTFLLTDGMGNWCPVTYAFVKSEQFALGMWLFEKYIRLTESRDEDFKNDNDGVNGPKVYGNQLGNM
ncbi:hypothetical protein CLF_106195 [Clonorchis sinensis]|uniref:ZSWIM1/3 RNaseH-like domain-containing protein n=1 Tax=Clonorchis sinensis TaxID=79923 RepID=G7YES4_CLOSI|nr:hypothetical protein CLF_106195 [Clonorchis sinensis]